MFPANFVCKYSYRQPISGVWHNFLIKIATWPEWLIEPNKYAPYLQIINHVLPALCVTSADPHLSHSWASCEICGLGCNIICYRLYSKLFCNLKRMEIFIISNNDSDINPITYGGSDQQWPLRMICMPQNENFCILILSA